MNYIPHIPALMTLDISIFIEYVERQEVKKLVELDFDEVDYDRCPVNFSTEISIGNTEC